MTQSKFSPRQALMNEALFIIAKANYSGASVSARYEARRLYTKHPQSGMSEEDIVEFLVQRAINGNLAIDTMA